MKQNCIACSFHRCLTSCTVIRTSCAYCRVCTKAGQHSHIHAQCKHPTTSISYNVTYPVLRFSRPNSFRVASWDDKRWKTPMDARVNNWQPCSSKSIRLGSSACDAHKKGQGEKYHPRTNISRILTDELYLAKQQAVLFRANACYAMCA